MSRSRPVAARFALAVLVIALLFTATEAAPTRQLPVVVALVFWMASVGAGLALAAAAAAGLSRWLRPGSLAGWQLIGLAGLIGLIAYTPLSQFAEHALFADFPDDDPADDWLDHLEALGGAYGLAAELLQVAPPYLLTWVLLNVAPAAATGWARQPVAAPRRDPEFAAAPPPAPEAVPEVAIAVPTDRADAPSAAAALGWPPAIGDDVLSVTADLHYLHVRTTLGRTTVLGSLSAVEAHFDDAGFRIHRSHWVAKRAIRRVIQAANGWRCELHDGERLPISRRRVADIKRVLGRDFVLEAS